MPTIQFRASRTIAVPAAIIWDILTDYREAHPSITPKPAFSHFVVEEGGLGAGTVMRFDFRVAGSTRHFHQRVSAPEPGRVLVEHDIDGEGQTSFTLTPVERGEQTRVDILTSAPTSPGLRGRIEAWLATLIAPQMQRLYDEELGNLDRLAHTRAPQTAGV